MLGNASEKGPPDDEAKPMNDSKKKLAKSSLGRDTTSD